MKRDNAKYRILLLLLPVLWGVFIVCNYGVNTVFWDEWEIVKLYDTIVQNGIDVSAFFAQHNEHRIFFPRIILLLTGVFFDWNVKLQMFIGQLEVVVVYIICFLYTKDICKKNGNRVFGEAGWLEIVTMLCIGFLIFNTSQYGNFLWGFQVGFLLVVLSATACFYFFHRGLQANSKKLILISILCGVVSSFSAIQGLLVWIVLLIVFTLMFVSKYRVNPKCFFLILISGLCVWALYFYGFHAVGGHPDIGNNTMGNTLLYFLAAIGNIISFMGVKVCIIFGGAILLGSLILAYIVIFKQKKLKENIFPLCLGLYGYAVAAVLAVGRSGFGIEQALSSRYASFTGLIFVGISIILYDLYSTRVSANRIRKQQSRVVVIAIVILFTLLIENILYLPVMKGERDYRRVSSLALANYENVDLASLNFVYPWNTYDEAYEEIEILKRHNIKPFNMGGIKKNAYGRCDSEALESVELRELTFPVGFDISSIKQDDKFIYFENPWAIDAINQELPEAVFAKINGKLYRTVGNIRRPDVAAFFKNSKYEYAGFHFAQKKEILNKGDNTISLIIIDATGNGYYETNPITFNMEMNQKISQQELGQRFSKKDGTTSVAVDEVNEKPFSGRIESVKGRTISIRGWAIDEQSRKSPSQVLIKIGDDIYSTQGVGRGDVADFFGEINYINSGFQGNIDISGLTVGVYPFSLIVIAADGKSYYEVNQNWTVEVLDNAK